MKFKEKYKLYLNLVPSIFISRYATGLKHPIKKDNNLNTCSTKSLVDFNVKKLKITQKLS